MKKRLLVITLIFTLILNQFAVSTLAASPTDDENLDYAQKLKKVGVFLGTDEGFELERPATRLEGIIMLIRLLGEEEEALDTYYDIPFTDVPDWATSYVSYAYNYGLSNGISDTQFGSMDELTNNQYFTFMARALGYLDSEGDFNWEESITFMKDLGFITADEQVMYEGNSLLRSDVAKLSFELMKQPVKDSLLLLADQLLQSGDLDPAIATEIGIYTPIKTDREDTATLSENKLSAMYDTININRSIEEGYPSPYSVPETTMSTSDFNNIITFTNGLTGQKLYDSLTHKGFSELTAVYDISDITWYDFSDSLSITPNPSTLTTKLKADNLYEYNYHDEFEQLTTYYQSKDNIYYEVTDIYYGDYSEPIEDLTKDIYGTKAYMHPFSENDYPTYNPLILSGDESLLYITFTTLNDKTVLYLEKGRYNSFVQQWISLKDGLVVKEYIFDDDGIIKSIQKNTSITYEPIADSVFVQPDIDYFDLTLMIFALTYNNLENLQLGLVGTFPEEPFSFDLLANGEQRYNVHVSGYNGGTDFSSFGYISTGIDSLGNEIELRQFYDEEFFHTIAPSMEMDQVYAGSIHRLMMFDLDELSFRDFKTTGNIETYTFEDTNYAGVSGLHKYFEYNINTATNKVENITEYGKDSINSTERYIETVYTFENFGTYDESLFEVPDNYIVLESPLEVYYDGEHALQWYYHHQFELE